ELAGFKTGDKLDDLSPAAEQRNRDLFVKGAKGFEAYEREALSPEEQLFYDIALSGIAHGEAALELKTPFSPSFPTPYRLSQLGGPYLTYAQLLQSFHPMITKENAEDYIARLGQVNAEMQDFITTWSIDIGNGIIAPRFALEKTSATLAGMLQGEARDNGFYTTFATKLEGIEGLSAEEKADLLVRAETAVRDSVVPGYQALKAKVDETIPLASTDAGVWAQPGGEKLYAFAIKVFTNTGLSGDEIHALGLAEVERISAEADAIFRSIGMNEGTVGERFAALSEDPKQIYPNTPEGREALLKYLQDNNQVIMETIPAYFAFVPKSGVEVRRVPEYAEATSPGGYYTQPSFDGSQPGIFWINLRDTREQPVWTLKTLLYHEAAPGHHFEFAQTLEVPDRPLFRKYYFSSNYSEGWALYAERLAAEMGAYADDPAGDLGRLNAEMLRAVRLVVDSGMHHKKWTREEAIDYMASHTGTDRSLVETEIERYAVWPGQALGYKMGMLKILELRGKAQAALGDAFDIKAFHQVILGEGAMPMNIVEARVGAWIDSQK
ncbi:MAG TPA: DUF885 domain-containing protein, partial [Sphingomonadales bacterium]|nr:DUF885 domain-containing protein [Sphingomonadales bacterium]